MKTVWVQSHIIESLRDPGAWQAQTVTQLHDLAMTRKDCPSRLSADDVRQGVWNLVQSGDASFRNPDVAFLTEEQVERNGGIATRSWSMFEVGAVAMLDALGFSGIWQGTNGQRDLRALATLRWVDVEFNVGAMSLSDTLVFHVGVSERFEPSREALTTTGLDPGTYRERLNSLALLSVVKMVASALRVASNGPKPLSFRGAIAVGPFLVEPPFLIGPCVDDAANQMEAAEGAFVWLRPSALAIPPVWETFAGEWHWLARKYDVPMKDGGKIFTRVVDPGADAEGVQYWRNVLATMPENDPKIAEKRSETSRFARHLVESQNEQAEMLTQGRVARSSYWGMKWDD